MIFDRIENHMNYRGISKGIDTAFDFLLNTNLEALEPGKYLIEGEDVFAVCMEYETKNLNLSKNEAHKKYIDVQYIVSGTEMMNVSAIKDLLKTEEYDEAKDVIFYEHRADCSFAAGSGCFAVFFPEDAHMPGIFTKSGPENVKKVVVKVHV
jgi:YhcH/YjgK/YiaL family protein